MKWREISENWKNEKSKLNTKLNLITILNYKLMIHEKTLEGKHVC